MHGKNEPAEVIVDVAGVGRRGRDKVNCTVPAVGERGAYFWYSYRWLMRDPDGSWFAG